ncbi:DDE-type integrase/transposase/recombinase [Pseudomonas syringae]|nr:DDE-type integrase/transposase/recombinase [Pseudomonas syringae]MCF4987250.1 DDE-type integrase/transposase/recombinase [Pseudomonas syringae]MCF5197784.1 DDE-type integrase/transposase/recombinase [Pseudomonas syringae]MCF5203570.1 DDE-type integrase/transposase/recombinase [Pseudomonas syringae]MCF5207736.1 DDE-type integrase/transposase/recombinase [Pseudomonas syringae]MCF5215999.1 DDE-type integrase/transposase/recombinase [Pseudomonas syringae]
MDAKRSSIPVDSLLQLRQRLDRFPKKSPERATQVASIAELYGVSPSTVYRALNLIHKPHTVHRADRGKPRVLQRAQLERYCELIAALKLRTTNKQGRHLSTRRAIELLEDYGVETEQGLVRAPKGILTRSTVNEYLGRWLLNQSRLLRQPPAVRFQAEHSNDCWQFDLSPSDLKHIDKPEWIDPSKGEPTLMLFSVVDDRSGVAYQEYHCVYGEDAETALRFLFNAMVPKADPTFPFQGRPKMIYLDNGPVAKRRVFQNVMQALGIEWQTHIPAGKDGTRTTARSKGKVERPFRTVKEAHETLYHFHKPETEVQANEWLMRYLVRTYNVQGHRCEPHSRIEDWLANLPAEGLREMCTWEQFCRFAREPERRKVGIDARVTIEGTTFEVEPDMAGESVVLLWGLFDNELYAEFNGERFGPFYPVSGPIPLHRYRAFRRSKADERSERIRSLADQLGLPIAALAGNDVRLTPSAVPVELPRLPFDAEAHEYHFPSVIAAKLAVANELAQPLAKLSKEDLAFIHQVVSETLIRRVVLERVRSYFRNKKRGEEHAG